MTKPRNREKKVEKAEEDRESRRAYPPRHSRPLLKLVNSAVKRGDYTKSVLAVLY
jgi:hypothetical protein